MIPPEEPDQLEPDKPISFRAKETVTWEKLWGSQYGTQIKEMYVKPILQKFEPEFIGRNVVDVGGGAHPVSNFLMEEHAIVSVDIAGEETQKGGILRLNMDVREVLKGVNRATQRKLMKIGLFFEIDVRSYSNDGVDCFLFSEILNYIDWRAALDTANKHLKTGGTIFIANQPGRGFHELFSVDGIRSDSEIIDYFESNNYQIVCEAYEEIGIVPADQAMMFILAQKGSL